MSTENTTSHVTPYLGAYYDGELHGEARKRVETHLQACEACQAELEALAALSTLLQEAPPAQIEISPVGTAVQVERRIASENQDSSFYNLLSKGWRFTPVFLVLTWAFGRAVLLVSGFVSALLPRNLTLYMDALPGVNLQPGWLSWLQGRFTEILPQGAPETLFEFGMISLLLTLFIGILMICWLASAWAYRQHKILESKTS